MIVKIKVEKEFDIRTLHVEARVRYWEDATVNGVEDVNGNLIPCRRGDIWKPVIDIETGEILNWDHGIKANIHYKVCDAGVYVLRDVSGEAIITIDGYVPSTLSPKESGYGDYIIMDVNENGMIDNWRFKIKDFTEEED